MRFPLVSACLATASAMVLAMPTASPAQDANDRTDQAGKAAGAGDNSYSGDIIVTANRTNSLASHNPIALTAVTGAGLLAAGITNPTDLADQIPGLSIDRNAGLQITIRGVTSTDSTEKGDPSAAFLVYGIYIARPQAQEVSFFDIDRVEVLRGPQGTLYGRNTTAGVVNVISSAPKHEFAASADAAYGNYDTIQATGMINLPVNDAIAIRAAVNYDRRVSYIIKGVSSPCSLDPFKENYSARLSALYDISSDLHLIVRGDYSKQKGIATNTVLASNFFRAPFAAPAADTVGTSPICIAGSSAERRTLTYAEAQQATRDNETWGIQGELNWNISDALTLTYLGGYRELTRNELGTTIRGRNAAGNLLVHPNNFESSYRQISRNCGWPMTRAP